MPSLALLYDKLQTIILERFAAPGGINPAAFVAFEFGTPIPEDTFRLRDPDRTLSPELATEFLSHHVDTVPDVRDMMFTRSERSVENQYEILLLGATASDAASMQLVGGIKRSASNAFDNTVTSFLGPDRFRPVQATPVNWYDQSVISNWIHVRIDQHDTPSPTHPGSVAPVNPRLLQWRVMPKAFQPALKQPVHQTFQALAIEQVAKPAPQLHEGFPLRPPRPRQNAFVKLHRRDTKIAPHAKIAPHKEQQRSPLFVKLAAFDFNATIVKGSSQQPVAADQFTLDVWICIVQVRRPWLSDALLSLPNWHVAGFTKGSFSSAPPNHAGNLSIVPTACILIRDLKITAQWSDADRTVIEKSANFGSFNLFGRSFDSNTMTLVIPGMQSFAWVCEPMPVLPPDDPPAN